MAPIKKKNLFLIIKKKEIEMKSFPHGVVQQVHVQYQSTTEASPKSYKDRRADNGQYLEVRFLVQSSAFSLFLSPFSALLLSLFGVKFTASSPACRVT